jgi:flagellar biosynthesis protein FliQ
MITAAVEWSRGIEDAWSDIAAFVPKLVTFLVVLLIGLFVARAVRKVASRILAAAKLDQAVDKSGLGRTLKNAGIGPASGILVKVLYYGLVLLVLQLAIGALGPNPISDALRSMMSYIPKIAVAIAILFVTGIVADKVGEIAGNVTSRQSWGAGATKAAVAGIWLIGGFAALDQVQVAKDVVDTLFRTFITSLGAIMVIKFGVGGVWSARDRFWPRVYDAIGAKDASKD